MGNRVSEIAVHRIAIMTSMYITGIGLLTICMKLSTARDGMQMDRFCICVYIITYAPIDIVDCNDACGMYGTRIILINAVIGRTGRSLAYFAI